MPLWQKTNIAFESQKNVLLKAAKIFYSISKFWTDFLIYDYENQT